MMVIVAVSTLVLLLCNSISSDNIGLTRKLIFHRSLILKKCTNGSQCVSSQLCAECLSGYSPKCAEAICVNNQCKTISPCSVYTSTKPSTSTKTSRTTTAACKNNGQCPRPEICVVECKNRTGPLCASAKCVKGKCQTISPCSQTFQCTNKSQCAVPELCAQCKSGYTPPCAQVSCENGQCKTIMPCSVATKTTTTSPSDACTRDNQCPRSKICAIKCNNDTTPLCSSAKCADEKCINIKPCSEHICKTQATCPFNKRNCKSCPQGYGSRCEQAACLRGICSIVPPCSKKLKVSLSTELPKSN